MNRYKIGLIISWCLLFLALSFAGWQYVINQKDIFSRLNKLEEHQETIKRAIEEHLNGGLGW